MNLPSISEIASHIDRRRKPHTVVVMKQLTIHTMLLSATLAALTALLDSAGGQWPETDAARVTAA